MNSDMKTNEKLTLIHKYHDEAKTKLWYEHRVDQFGQKQGEEKTWFDNGQIGRIANFKDGIYHGKYQDFWMNGRRYFIDSNHHKKGLYGTQIIFEYENK